MRKGCIQSATKQVMELRIIKALLGAVFGANYYLFVLRQEVANFILSFLYVEILAVVDDFNIFVKLEVDQRQYIACESDLLIREPLQELIL